MLPYTKDTRCQDLTKDNVAETEMITLRSSFHNGHAVGVVQAGVDVESSLAVDLHHMLIFHSKADRQQC